MDPVLSPRQLQPRHPGDAHRMKNIRSSFIGGSSHFSNRRNYLNLLFLAPIT